jgi:streptogrisin D
MTTRRVLAVVAAAVVSTAVGVAPTAQAVQSAHEPSIQDRMLAQQPLIRAADVIQAEVLRGGHTGFAGLVLEADHVDLWWKGAVPAAVTSAVKRAETRAPVEIEAARYSNLELRAAARVIDSRRGPASPVHAVKVPADGSGLVLGTTSAAATAAFTSLVDVPVRTVVEAPLVPVSRQNDSPPWRGGATIVLGNAACTSGFSVRNGANQRFLLTAGHCGNPGVRVTDPTGEFIGNAGAKHGDHDIMLIPTGNVVNQQYVGGGDSNSVEIVRGWGDVYTGEFLCQSGVTSARETGNPVCNIKVLFFYADREDLVEGEQMNGQPAARPGDSGGPVYGPAAGGGVIAKGTVTRTAGARIGFQDFRTASRDFGVYIPL